MKSFLYSLVCVIASAGISGAIPFGFWKAAAGGGGGAAWVNSMDPAGITSSDNVNEYPHLMPVTADQTGTCSKVRVYVDTYSGTTVMKAGLYDNARNLLQQGSVSVTAVGWAEITITGQAVTASTVYRVGWVIANAGFISTGQLAGQPSGTSDLNYGGSYAASMENPFTTSAGTSAYPVGLYITP